MAPTSPRVNVQDSRPTFAFLGMPGGMGLPVGSCELLSGPGAAILLRPKPANLRCPPVASIVLCIPVLVLELGLVPALQFHGPQSF